MDLQGILYPALILGGLGLVFGLLLAYASKRFHVETDPRVEQVRERLPGANCGGCGFPGCDAYAEAVVLEGAKPNLCAAGGRNWRRLWRRSWGSPWRPRRAGWPS